MPTREYRARRLGIPIEQLPDGRGKHGNHARGVAHPRWNNKRIVSSHGYTKIRVGKHHPYADPNGYAYEHTLVWVSAGRRLSADSILHHINGDKQDNRLENLQRMTQGNHVQIHIDRKKE